MSPKFKVGDRVAYDRFTERMILVIQGTKYDRYLYKFGHQTHAEIFDIDIEFLEEFGIPLHKDIANTKIARKMHPNHELLENGKLRIKV